jgi:hypothetical protein
MNIHATFMSPMQRVSAALALCTLAACGGTDPPIYKLGGTASGVAGPGLVLRNNGADSLSVPASGGFTFRQRLAQGATYAVTVSGHPAGQTCSVSAGSGTMDTAHVTDVAVTCVAADPPAPPPPNTYTVGGLVSGLTGSGLVLTNNGVNDLAVTANGAFTFSARIATGMPYAVAIATQPSGQTCTLANASGTVASSHISNVTVTCAGVSEPPPPPGSFTIGGSVSQLTASGLVLHNNGGDALTVQAAATSFSFPVKVADGGAYQVTVATQPGSGPSDSQDCAVTNGSGNAVADVSNVVVSCGPMGPLTVLGSDPPAEATNVPRTVRPSFNFSSAVAPSTVLPANLRLLTQGIDLEGTRSVSDRRVTLSPAHRLLPLTPYTFIADLGIGGRRGELFGAPVSTGFTTGDGTWRGIEPLGDGSVSNEVATARDGMGNVLAVWIDGTQRQVHARRFDAATGNWGVIDTLHTTAGTSTFLNLGVDGSGNAVAAWRDSNGTTEPGIWAARFGGGTPSWEASRRVATGSLTDPQIAVGLHGRVALSFSQVEAAGGSLWLTMSTTSPGSAWSAPDRVDSAGAPAGAIQSTSLAMSPVGETVLVWSKRGFSPQPDTRAVWARRYQAGVALDVARVISLDTGVDETNPRAAVDNEGGIHVVWQDAPAPDKRRLLFSYLARNGNWGVAQPLPITGDWVGGARIATHRGDTGLPATWVSWLVAGESGSVQVAPVTAGTVGAAHTLDMGVAGVAAAERIGARLAVDGAGNVLAIWPALAEPNAPAAAPLPGGQALSVARYGALPGSWASLPPLGSDVAPTGMAIDLAINPVGDAAVLWVGIEGTAGSRRLRLRRFE